MKESAVRSRILNVAIQLFYEQGYNSTGINQVIAEANIARASLYHHFPSKTDLLIAALEQAMKDWYTDMDTMVSACEDPLEKLWALFEFRLSRQVKTNFTGCRFVRVSNEVSSQNQEVYDLVLQQKHLLKTYLKNIVLQLKRDNPDKLSDEMLTEAIYLMMEGATVTGSIHKQPFPFHTSKKVTMALI
jgi:AcrR family transcriptional regulator